MPALRNTYLIAVAAALLGGPVLELRASNGVAVVIDKESLGLVGAGAHGCPDDHVAFVHREGRVHAICAAPAPVAVFESPVLTPAPPAPESVWAIAVGESIEASFRAWLPADWRLAWDSAESPVAESEFKHVGGEPMEAIAQAFDRRSLWGSHTLIACAFPAEQILQVRSSGTCGAP